MTSVAVQPSNTNTNKLLVAFKYPEPRISFAVTAYLNPRTGGGRPRTLELVKSEWLVQDVVGHQVQVCFVPSQGAKVLLSDSSAENPLRVPIIRVLPRPGQNSQRGSKINVTALRSMGDDILERSGEAGRRSWKRSWTW